MLGGAARLILFICLAELKALGQEELDRLERRNEKSSSDHGDLDDKTTYYQSKYPNIPAHRYDKALQFSFLHEVYIHCSAMIQT